jgi:hypothetical protein
MPRADQPGIPSPEDWVAIAECQSNHACSIEVLFVLHIRNKVEPAAAGPLPTQSTPRQRDPDAMEQDQSFLKSLP